jgi:hypothetical protein
MSNVSAATSNRLKDNQHAALFLAVNYITTIYSSGYLF